MYMYNIYTYIYIYIYIYTYTYICNIYIYMYIHYIYKTLRTFFVDGMQLPQGYAEPLREDSLLSTRTSWYSLDQYRKDESLR